ncbi:BLOC-3 complex member HPS1-like [Uloborus diversus]|uniref:BLOC-3 complex member HPS1-like n=1 Tax=Uloborus diversus TaxID=327109 RepID=UPI00240A5822|nr:BLOC-3 complex member HPS1-like [Uloborus diversus]
MKGSIIFNNLSDLIFFDVDEELSDHLQKLALKDGLLEVLPFRASDGAVEKNVVMQLFSPLIASYKVMQAQFGNKYKYIESEDGVLLVFDEVLNYIVINICLKEENLAETQKKLSLFLTFLEMLYGPCVYMIKNDIPSCLVKTSRSFLLSKVISKWENMKKEQQMFLVEVLLWERLIINQDITASCINLLQEILERTRQSHKGVTYSHAFALVDTKLLALYSSRNSEQLPKENLLQLILVVQALRTANPAEQVDSDDEFFIPISSALSDQDEMLNVNKSSIKKKSKVFTQSLLLFIKSQTGSLVPHVLYAVEVTPIITIVLLCELTPHVRTSSLISTLIVSFDNLQCSRHQSYDSKTSFQSLEKDVKSLIDAIWKSKDVKEKEKQVKKIIIRWEQLKQCELEQFIYTSKDNFLNPRLDSALSSMCELLQNLFEELVANHCFDYEANTWTAEYQNTLSLIQKLSMKRMSDFSDFLEVKAVQNLTIASYITEFPGLLHFIYVDRNCDYLIAPAISPRKKHLNEKYSLKKKIWKMIEVGRRYLDGINKFCCLWKDEDLYYFYTIWFENSTGKIIKPFVYPDTKKFPLKGILCGNFYKRLVKECFPKLGYEQILCYELFCVHLATTPADVIIDHSRRLCSQLWDFTGAYQASLDLL